MAIGIDELEYHRLELRDQAEKLTRAVRQKTHELKDRTLARRIKTVEDVQAVVNRMAEDIENEIRRIEHDEHGKK